MMVGALKRIRSHTAAAVRMMLSEVIIRHPRRTTEGESTNREQTNVKRLRNRGWNPKLSYQQTCWETAALFSWQSFRNSSALRFMRKPGKSYTLTEPEERNLFQKSPRADELRNRIRNMFNRKHRVFMRWCIKLQWDSIVPVQKEMKFLSRQLSP